MGRAIPSTEAKNLPKVQTPQSGGAKMTNVNQGGNRCYKIVDESLFLALNQQKKIILDAKEKEQCGQIARLLLTALPWHETVTGGAVFGMLHMYFVEASTTGAI